MRSRVRLPGVVIAFVALAIVIGLWRLTAGLGGSLETEPAPTVPTVAVADEVDDSLDGGWARVDLPGRGRLRSVWEIGDTLYAAGWDNEARRTVVWSSPGGVVWRPTDSSKGPFDDAVVYDMIGFQGQVLAVGTRLSDAHPVLDEVAVPAVWASTDGEEFVPVAGLSVELWVPADTEAPGGFIAGGFSSVEAFGEGLILGGWEGVADPLTGLGDTLGSVWTSSDGVAFSRALSNPEAFGPAGSIVRSIQSDGESLVAAGVSQGSAAVWVSPDGQEWEQRVRDDQQGSSALVVSPGPTGALILGRGVLGEGDDLTDALRLWTSSDAGYVLVPPAGLGEGLVADLAFGAQGLVAAGSVPLGESSLGAVWSSADGGAWSRVTVGAMPRNSVINSVVAGDTAVVAVGEVYGQPSVWVRALGEVEEVVAGVGSLVAPPAWLTVFQENEPADSVPDFMQRAGDFLYGVSAEGWLWRSQDGDVWTLQDFAAAGLEGAGPIRQIVASEAGWIALAEGEGGKLWFSADGERWGRPTLAPPCCAAAVFREGSGFVALLREEQLATWLRASSTDGIFWELDAEPVDLPVTDLQHVASIGPLALVLGESTDTEGTVFGSLDGTDWFSIGGPDGVFSGAVWERVWDLGGEVVAAGTVEGEPVLYRTNDGVDWQPLSLPELDVEAFAVEDVGGFGDGLAVLIGSSEGPSRLLTYSGIGAREEIPLDVSSGFGGLWSILVPNDERLRLLGPDHGRMTIWEWVPEP